MWFNKKDINIKLKKIIKHDITGYVLPHAGTTYTGNIISHTLRFRPSLKRLLEIQNILIIYLPSQRKENVEFNSQKYFHEFFVPLMSLKYYYSQYTNLKFNYYGYNVTQSVCHNESNTFLKSTIPKNINKSNTLFIISSDFSHHLPMQQAIELENKAAHLLLFKKFKDYKYLLTSKNNKKGLTDIEKSIINIIKIIDDIRSYYFFEELSEQFGLDYLFHWVGRTRSYIKPLNNRNLNQDVQIKQGVGYLSFLILDNEKTRRSINENKPQGLFITGYDDFMVARECLGNIKEWSPQIELELKERVKSMGESTSRLTGLNYENITSPVSNFNIQYLYKDKNKDKHKGKGINKFIRGWHGIEKDAFYLPSVFLENTYENGQWINHSNQTWKKISSNTSFNMSNTFKKLNIKASKYGRSKKINNLLPTYNLYTIKQKVIK